MTIQIAVYEYCVQACLKVKKVKQLEMVIKIFSLTIMNGQIRTQP